MTTQKNITPEAEVSILPGISEARAKLLAKLDIFTVDDLVRYFPRMYADRSVITKVCDLLPEQIANVELTVTSPLYDRRIPSGGRQKRPMTVQKVKASDDTGSVELTFFNQSYLKNTLVTGRKFRFSGKVTGNFTSVGMTSPSFEAIKDGEELPKFVPVYRQTAKLSSKLLSATIKHALEIYKDGRFETLTPSIMEEYDLIPLYDALCSIHFPENDEKLEKARRRLCFEELLDFQIKLMLLGKRERSGKAYAIPLPDMRAFSAALPFELTEAQKKSIREIVYDMCGKNSEKREDGYTVPARRLIQGDVGSGKTMVAAAAMYACATAGYQSALMVPTEILAEQHYKSLSALFEKFGIKSALLTGATGAKERKEILAGLADKSISVLIGTHAIIGDKVEFASLALTVTDEQHRFGVKQREKLSGKRSSDDTETTLHMLVMSATPIPRTLAMMLYGDLDISVIDVLPNGRQKIDTYAVGENMRKRINAFIKKTVGQGHQVYIVCPLVEREIGYDKDFIPYISDEAPDASAIEYAEKLKNEVFPELSVGCLHGRMKNAEKDKVMRDFAEGKIDVLVSTTVIEVGVDVPNATLMIIENAERFGLTQLHQLRGRVGRGKDKSYCILISEAANSDGTSAKERLGVLCNNSSGFAIAQRDLEMRGPGEFFGRMQHGELRFKIADIASDIEIVSETKKLAEKIVADMESKKEKNEPRGSR